MHIISRITVLVLAVALAGPVLATDRIVREHRFDATNVGFVDISAAVGRVEVRAIEGDEIRVRLDIEGKRSGLLRRRAEVSKLDLTANLADGRLELAFRDDEATADWIVELPHRPAMRIDVGVGDLDVHLAGGDLAVKVGVGAVALRMPLARTGSVQASAGIGSASIDGAAQNERSRALVAEKASATGQGSASLTATVGIGDITIRLE